jgi:hypothetical protein
MATWNRSNDFGTRSIVLHFNGLLNYIIVVKLRRLAGMRTSSENGQPAKNTRGNFAYSCIYVVLSETHEFQICLPCYKWIEGSYVRVD